ncbi:MAG TPA: sugar ABC transporter permease [Thermomicrobiales bacterium]|nr:sugar ABC transporter permease [Thermomicrobiales bacterium]
MHGSERLGAGLTAPGSRAVPFSRALRANLPGLLFVAPALVLTFGLLLLPLVRVAWMSLHDWPILGERPFIGLDNYTALVNDSAFWNALRFTTTYTLLVTPAILLPALGLALLVNERMRGVTLFRALYFTPYVIAFVTGSLMWKWLYNDVFGLLNYLLIEVGLIDRPILWLGSPNMALFSIILSVVWKTAGFNMVLLLGGLQSIPPDLYEAAALDGAGPWKRFVHITLPLLRSTFAVVLTISVIGSFLAFDQFQVMTAGGPGHATTTIVMLIRKTSFEFFEMGSGSAMSIVLLVILMVLSYLQIRVLRRANEY